MGGLRLRRILTVLQFATAMGLTSLTLAVTWQTHYASNLNPGFDPAPLLIVRTDDDIRSANVRAFEDALRRLPGVSGVAVTDSPVTVNFNSTALKRDGGNPIEISWSAVSPEFFQVLGLKPAAGRLYDASRDKREDRGKIVINEAGARRFGFASAADAVGKTVRMPNGEEPMQVIGVAPDIRHRSAREAMQPTVYYLGERIGTFTVRTSQGQQAVQAAIEEMWPRYFPNDVLELERMAALFSQSYADDLRLAKLLAASSVIATAIAAFGIYVLAAYSVQRKARDRAQEALRRRQRRHRPPGGARVPGPDRHRRPDRPAGRLRGPAALSRQLHRAGAGRRLDPGRRPAGFLAGGAWLDRAPRRVRDPDSPGTGAARLRHRGSLPAAALLAVWVKLHRTPRFPHLPY